VQPLTGKKGWWTVRKQARLFWRRLCGLAVLLMSLPVLNPSASAETAQSGPLSAVYVYDGSKVQYYDDDAQSIDQMFYAFAVFRNGRLSVSHWKNFKTFQKYIEKHPNIVPILSIGGWGADGFSQAAATAEGRASFAEDALSLMQEYGFRGVDIDWEYPGSSDADIKSSPMDRKNYTLLLRALREGLDALTAADGIPRRLCIALSGAPWLIDNLECGEIGEIVDQVNLMTYDLQMTNLASHHSALYASHPRAFSAAAGAEAYIRAGIPANKIMLGIAFYGHRWTTKEKEPLYARAAYKDTLSYTAIKKLIVKNPGAVYYDAVAQAPYYADGKVFISYDDERSILQKKLYAEQQGLLGLFAWQYGSDAGGELVHAMKAE
jgi:chitinase